MTEETPSNVQINDVLKALNHDLRRDILIYLAELEPNFASFTDLVEVMKFTNKSSGQFSYHLKLLIDSNLIFKEEKGNKYSLTPLGKRATELLSLTDDTEEESLVQHISKAFRDLSPRDEIILAFQGLPFGFLVVGSTYLDTLFVNGEPTSNTIFMTYLFTFLTLMFFVIYLVYAYTKLQSILAIIALTNITWIVFVPKKHIIIIYLTSFFGFIMFFQMMFYGLGSIINVILAIIGFGLIIISLITSFLYYNNEKWV